MDVVQSASGSCVVTSTAVTKYGGKYRLGFATYRPEFPGIGATTDRHGHNYAVWLRPCSPGFRSNALVEFVFENVDDMVRCRAAPHEGIPWDWETFPEYLDAIDTPYTIDIGAQVPHVAIRHYVMGDRCYEDATPSDMAAMREITRQALEAGALGFSTSRFYGHLDKAGNLVPGTNATAEEMCTIGDAFTGVGHGTIEIISDWLDDKKELAWIEHIARTTGRPITTLTGTGVQGIWSLADTLAKDGLTLPPPSRSTTCVYFS